MSRRLPTTESEPKTSSPVRSPVERARPGAVREGNSPFLKRAPAQARGDRSVRRVLEACEALLAEQPFEEITVEGIARRADVPVSSMYFFFNDRLSIFFRLIEVTLDQIADEYVLTERVLNQPLSAFVRNLERRLARIWAQHKHMLDLFFSYRVHPSVLPMVIRLQKYVDAQLFRKLTHDFPSLNATRRQALARVINGNLMQGLDIAAGMPPQKVRAFQVEWSGMLHAHLHSLDNDHSPRGDR